MNVLFLSPAALWLLILAALPLLVHLFSKTRPPAYRFSNLDFLKRAAKRSSRFTRPKDVWLLALRTLALLLLVLAFANPVATSPDSALPGEPTAVVIVIDRSASMAARDGAGTRFDLACSKARSFLQSTKPDAANLVWIDSSPDAVFPQPAPNRSFLIDLLKSASPTLEAGSPATAIDLALRQLASARGRRKLLLISDFQNTAWKSAPLQIPASVSFIPFQAVTSTPANTCVQHVIPQPANPVAGQPLTLLARVRNLSPEPVAPTITLNAGGARQSQPVSLSPWAETDCLFSLRPSRPGPMEVTVSTSPDAFPFDDACFAVVDVRDRLRVRISTPSPARPCADAAILARATRALPWLELQPPNSTSPADFHWLDGWHGNRMDEISVLRKQGTTVILRPSPDCPPASLQSLLSLAATPAPPVLQTSSDGWPVIPDTSHPAHALFQSGDFGNPYAGSFRERISLPPAADLPPSARVLARYADAVPAVVEISSPATSAPLLVWNLPLDPKNSDWPSRGTFLPCLAELLLHARANPSSPPVPSLPGSRLSWSSNDPTVDTRSLTLLAPNGLPIAARASNVHPEAGWSSQPTTQTGFYRWQISNQDVALSAVNFPAAESDLRTLDAPPTPSGIPAEAVSLDREVALSRGISLWPILTAAVILLLGAECLLLPRHSSPAPDSHRF